MIHEAYMPVYRCPDFHCVHAGSPEVVQEALADLKKCSNVQEYNGIVLRRYDKSLRIQFQYERWKGRPSSQSCHDSSEHKLKYKYKHKYKYD